MRTSDTSITVTWRKLSIVEARGILIGYSVEYGPPEQQRGQVRLVDVGPEEGKVMITDLNPEVAYHVVVYAATAVGRSASDTVIVEAATVQAGESYIMQFNS